jgi:hypothetical protein
MSHTIICIAIGQYSPHSYPPPLRKVENQALANSITSIMSVAVGIHLRLLKSLLVGESCTSGEVTARGVVTTSGVVSLGELSS